MQVNKELNFQKYPESMIDTMGVPYDLASIMHYGAYVSLKKKFVKFLGN